MKKIKEKIRILLILLVIDVVAFILSLPIFYLSGDYVEIQKVLISLCIVVFYEIMTLFVILPLIEYIFDNL